MTRCSEVAESQTHAEQRVVSRANSKLRSVRTFGVLVLFEWSHIGREYFRLLHNIHHLTIHPKVELEFVSLTTYSTIYCIIVYLSYLVQNNDCLLFHCHVLEQS